MPATPQARSCTTRRRTPRQSRSATTGHSGVRPSDVRSDEPGDPGATSGDCTHVQARGGRPAAIVRGAGRRPVVIYAAVGVKGHPHGSLNDADQQLPDLVLAAPPCPPAAPPCHDGKTPDDAGDTDEDTGLRALMGEHPRDNAGSSDDRPSTCDPVADATTSSGGSRHGSDPRPRSSIQSSSSTPARRTPAPYLV